jgi:hypothetical protein
MTLEQARERIGDGVVYRSGGDAEDGVITSVNSTYVFVRYRGDTGSKATYPEDLEFLARKATA